MAITIQKPQRPSLPQNQPQRSHLTPEQIMAAMAKHDPMLLEVASKSEAGRVARDYITADFRTQQTLKSAEMLAFKSCNVLIQGPSGTGKELIARILHGGRTLADKNDTFQAVNCSGIGRDLFESELFGHVKGSFTGAFRDRDGLFKSAGAGTAFLDEVGDLPLDQQAKLLRAIQTGRVRPVGADADVIVKCRFVFATHRNLREMVSRGTFREDLYYRISTIVLRTTAIRERPDDAILIANAKCAQNHWEPVTAVPQAVIESGGNVRAIENWLARVHLLALDEQEATEDL